MPGTMVWLHDNRGASAAGSVEGQGGKEEREDSRAETEEAHEKPPGDHEDSARNLGGVNIRLKICFIALAVSLKQTPQVRNRHAK
jgi:hypothetical protein